MALCVQEPDEDSALPALNSFQLAHVLRCAACQHQALCEHMAAMKCLHAATTIMPADPAAWLLLGRAIVALAADPAASNDASEEVIHLLGVPDPVHC